MTKSHLKEEEEFVGAATSGALVAAIVKVRGAKDLPVSVASAFVRAKCTLACRSGANWRPPNAKG